MGYYKENTDQSFGMFLVLILFLLFVFASSGNPEGHTSSSAKFPVPNQLVLGDFSNHRDAIISCPLSLPVLKKYCEFTPCNTSLITFSIRNKISDYNRRISQDFILIRKTWLSIEPVLHWRLYSHLPSDKDDDLPVLS